MAILGCIPRLRRQSLRLGFNSKKDMLDALPNDIIEKFLSKLPTYQVLQCRTVCKRWQHVIDDPLFAKAHTSENKREEEPSVVIFQCMSPGIPWSMSKVVDIGNFGLHLILPRRNKKELRKIDVRRMAMTPSRNIEINPSELVTTRYRPIIRGSCEGLIIFGSLTPPWRYSICNPVTRESVVLSKLSSDGLKFVCGLYFHSRRKEYRLLCATRSSISSRVDRFRYYTCGLNEESLEELGVHPCRPYKGPYEDLAPVIVDGFLHNMVDDLLHERPSIMVLDLDTEELSFKRHPRLDAVSEFSMYDYVLEVEGGLCVCHQNGFKLKISLLEDRSSWSWVKLLRVDLLDWKPPASIKHPLVIKDGGVLVTSENRGLVWYDMRTGRCKKIMTNAAYPYNCTGQGRLVRFPVATCKLSLVSLKQLNI